jgi:hypothetical protein
LRLKRKKARFYRYEGQLRANNINLDAISSDIEGNISNIFSNSQSSSELSKTSAVMNLIEFVLSFLNIGDWLISILRTVFSLVGTPPKFSSTSSAEYDRRVRKRGNGLSAYQPAMLAINLPDYEDFEPNQPYLSDIL